MGPYRILQLYNNLYYTLFGVMVISYMHTNSKGERGDAAYAAGRCAEPADRTSNRDPQIPAQSMDSCAMCGSTDCAARSMDCADPQIAPNIGTAVAVPGQASGGDSVRPGLVPGSLQCQSGLSTSSLASQPQTQFKAG